MARDVNTVGAVERDRVAGVKGASAKSGSTRATAKQRRINQVSAVGAQHRHKRIDTSIQLEAANTDTESIPLKLIIR